MKKHVIWIVVLLMLLSTAVALAANESSSMGTVSTTSRISPALAEGGGSITTLFAGGNGQAGNMFDFTVIGPNPITITSFDINVDNTNLHTAEVYYVTGGGTYLGNETNSGAWTMLGSSQVTGAGAGNPTPLPVGGLTVNPGETYGLYVTMSTCTCIDYTNGPLGPYSNADVELTLGSGNAYPFGTVFSPRIWNGTVYYDIVGGQVPDVQIEKSPDYQYVLPNGTADFTIAVTNTGTVTLTDVTVSDPLTPSCDSSLGDMGPGVATSYTCSSVGVTTSFTNTAVVTSTYNGTPGPTDSNDAYVEVVDAVLEIDKAPDLQTVASGGTANFTITVTNSGSIQIDNVAVSDALVPSCDNTIGAIPAGSSVSYACSDVGVTAGYTNTAVVTGVVDFPVPTITVSDDAVVELSGPTNVNLTEFGQAGGASSPLWLALILGIVLGFGLLLRRRLQA